MDKKTFMKELRQALSVLQEDELNDIISEYEQHIDMKMKNGLTEDEAIADFGSLPDLTADILEAYHVRADYAAEQKKEKKSFLGDSSRVSGREILQQTGKGCRAAGKKIVYGLHRSGLWLWGILLFLKKQLVRPFISLNEKWKNRRNGSLALPEKEGANVQQEEMSGVNRRERLSAASGRKARKEVALGAGNLIRNAVHNAFHFAAGCFHLGWRLVVWGLCAAWNICCVCVSLLCAGIGLLCLYILGLLTVLWIQRYPLAGVTIGCLGLVLCAFSVSGLCLTLLWKKRNKKPAGTGSSMNQSRKQNTSQEETPMEKKEAEVWYQEMEGGQHA